MGMSTRIAPDRRPRADAATVDKSLLWSFEAARLDPRAVGISTLVGVLKATDSSTNR
jgi:hypothetical protein